PRNGRPRRLEGTDSCRCPGGWRTGHGMAARSVASGWGRVGIWDGCRSASCAASHEGRRDVRSIGARLPGRRSDLVAQARVVDPRGGAVKIRRGRLVVLVGTVAGGVLTWLVVGGVVGAVAAVPAAVICGWLSTRIGPA